MGDLELISGLARELAAEESVEAVVRHGLAYLLRAAGAQAGALFLYGERRGELRMVGSRGLPLGFLREASRVKVRGDEGHPVSRAALERRMVQVELVDPALFGGDELMARRLGAVTAFPLALGDRVLGVLELFAPVGSDLPVLVSSEFRALCDVLALVLEKSQLVGEREHSLEVSRTLVDLSRTVLPVADVDEVLPRIVESAVRLLGGSSGCIAVWNAESRTLSIRAHLNLPGAYVRRPISVGEGLAGQVMLENQPILVQDYATWPNAHPLLAGCGFTSAVGVPLRAECEALGVLVVLANQPSVRFTREDTELLGSFAPSAAIALANASLFRQIRLKADQMAALLKISRRLTESLRLDSVLTSVLQEATLSLNAEAGTLHLVHTVGLTIAASSGSESVLPEAQELAAQAVTEGEPVAGVDATRTLLAVPLIVGSKRIGAVTVVRPQRDAFTDDDVAFLWTLATHAAMAIENARLHEEAEEQSIRDPLTGLFNVRRLQARLSEEALRAERYGRPLAFLMLDIDHFKRYNDTHGHLQGDRVLRQVADAVVRSVRNVDQVFRYGGEEICVLLPETPRMQAVLVAERIRMSVAACTFTGENGQDLGRVTVSLGLAACPEDAVGPRELIARADEALYEAKAQGRNRVVAAEARPAAPGVQKKNAKA